MAKSFEDRFFELLQGQFADFKKEVRSDLKGLNKKVDDNTKLTEEVKDQAMKTNGRVNRLEEQIKRKKSWLNFNPDTRLISLFFTALVIFLYIIASILHIRINL